MWRSNDRLKPTATKRIIFEEKNKTFRLYSGWNASEGAPSSLYAFTISPELCLEHLYWGPSLHHGFDLRYLGESSRSTVFSTAEMRENIAVSASTLELDVLPREPDTIEELLAMWKRNRTTVTPTKSKQNERAEQEEFQQRRMENLSWRMMTTHGGAGPPHSTTPSSSPSRANRRGTLVQISTDEALSKVVVKPAAGSSSEMKVSMTPPSPSHTRRTTPFFSPAAPTRATPPPGTVPGTAPDAAPGAAPRHHYVVRPTGVRGMRARSVSSANLAEAIEDAPAVVPGPTATLPFPQRPLQQQRPVRAEGLRISPAVPLVFPAFLSPPPSPSSRRIPPSPRGDRARGRRRRSPRCLAPAAAR